MIEKQVEIKKAVEKRIENVKKKPRGTASFTVSPNTVSSNIMLPQALLRRRDQFSPGDFIVGRLC
ncbi:hypothetical protein [Methanosarcina sp. DH2]|uniref:hypothetical protein n=1 Tax=Methanosarcina sp. DH2 TaxID=2605639 RepID=UPI001E5E3A9A|nr:hypothetical protein [Methanosarcina sp. DH2]